MIKTVVMYVVLGLIRRSAVVVVVIADNGYGWIEDAMMVLVRVLLWLLWGRQ